MVDLRMLGPLEAAVEGCPVPLGGTRQQLLLAALLLEAGRVIHVDRLVFAVWGDEPPPSARRLISVHVSGLRKAFRRAGCDEVIETVTGGYRLRSDAVRLDAAVAEELVGSARTAAAAGDGAGASARFREALDLWRGPVLDALRTPAIAQGAASWEEMRLVAFEEWAHLELALGRHLELVEQLTYVVAESPLRETPRALLMEALWRSGRRSEALEAYDDGHRLLVDELAMEPGDRLRELRETILRSEPRTGTTRQGATSAVAPRPAELPPAPAVFVGREAELELLDGLLPGLDDGCPVAVVSGTAGVGKSSLALRWAHRRADRFDDGQLFADLRGYDQDADPVGPAVLLDRFLRALGVPAEQIPVEAEKRAALFRSTAKGRRLLIVLDNAASVAQVRPLLPSSDGCLVVVTARRRLERLVASHGATLVPVDVMGADETARLMARVVGAERVDQQRTAVERLGVLCEGLPLALRVAAARLVARPGWTLDDLVSRLASEHGRLDQLGQGELQVRRSFELSYRNLTDEAALAFRRLGLVDTPAGIAPPVAAALIDGTLAEAEELCERLVDAQLLQPLGRDLAGQPRYRFHDLVRLFAKERAETEEPVEDRTAALVRAFRGWITMAKWARTPERGHMGIICDVSDQLWQPPDHSTGDDPLALLEAEHPNIVAAALQAARLGWSRPAWTLALSETFLLERHGYYDGWRAVTDSVLATCRQANDRHGEAVMTYSQGLLFFNQRANDRAEETLRRALTLFEDLGDERGRTYTMFTQASIQALRDLDGGGHDLEQAGAYFAATGDSFMEAQALARLANVAMLQGRLCEAETLLDRALARQPGQGNVLEAQLHKRLAEVYWRQGRGPDAIHGCERALDLVRDLHDLIGEAYVLHALGEARHQVGQHEAAMAALDRGLHLARDTGERFIEGRILLSLGLLGGASAVEHLRGAVEVLRAIGTWTWHERAVAALDEVTRGASARGRRPSA